MDDNVRELIAIKGPPPPGYRVCFGCGKDIKVELAACPYCGRPVPGLKPADNSKGKK